MKIHLGSFKSIFLVFLIAGVLPIKAQHMIIGSYNLRYANPNDTGNLWQDRAPVIVSLIRFHQFDILGIQEGLRNQLDDLTKDLPEFGRYGIGRDDGNAAGEHSAIFFNKHKFSLVEKGDFWLSETPEKPSLGWDAAINRICSWVKLNENSSGKTFYVFNAHYDHRGVVAREESSKLVLKKIKEIAGSAPAIFMGDLNGDHSSKCYQLIAQSGHLKDAYETSPIRYASNGSFNGFGNAIEKNNIIDHIFLTSSVSVLRHGILTDTYMGKYPSDHFPVLVEVSFK
jgi:endonuclease/exonuclease/phosphatase family metal-dependent hydrolase